MFGRSSSLVISVINEPKRKIREVIYARVRMGQCICHTEGQDPVSADDAGFCDKDARSLGVCVNHYQEFNRITANLDPLEEEKITDALVVEGQILRPQTIYEIKRESPISRIARQASESK
jgi:hypothetical protein